MKNVLIIAGAFFALSIVACNKNDDDAPPPPPTAVELITSATWKIDTIGFDADKNGEIDTEVPGGLAPCDMDNTISFSSDSTGLFDYNAKCNDAEPQSLDFKWSFKENNTILNIDGELPNGLTGDIDVLELTDTSFIFSWHVVMPVNTNIIVSLKK